MKVSANKIKEIKDLAIIGNPIDKSDFWFYVPELKGGAEDNTVFHVVEGDGTNLDEEDEAEGAVDYLIYDSFDGDISYSDIDKYQNGEEEALNNLYCTGGQVLLTSMYKDLSLQEICWRTLHFFGCEHPEKYTVRILSGKIADPDFPQKHGRKWDGPLQARDIVVAAWMKNGCDFMKTLDFIRKKKPLAREEVIAYVEMVEQVADNIGAAVRTIVDQDYPEEYKRGKNPPFVFLEKDGQRYLSVKLALAANLK